MKFKTFALATLALVSILNCSLQAQSTAFTYGGRLNDGSMPANGKYDLQFSLYSAATNGNLVAPVVINPAVDVSNGLFTTAIDFGAVFNGSNYWLAISVATNGATDFTALNPLQPITPAPYALFAPTAGSAKSVLAQNISGSISLGQLASGLVTNGASGVNISGAFTGNGTGLTNVNLSALAPAGSFGLTTNYFGGNFTLASSVSVGPNPVFVTAADVNGDGKVDLISVSSSTNKVTVSTNNGAGGFAIAGIYSVGFKPSSVGYGPDWVSTADLNGDGWLDLVTANYGDSSISVLTNNGSGGFVLSATYATGTNTEYCVVAADVNSDGKQDLICSSGGPNGSLMVLTNDGSGNFGSNAVYTVGSFPSGISTADVNGDGKVDLICANEGSASFTVLTNNGSGRFVASGTYGVGMYPYYVAVADVDGNGKPDLISANYGGNSLTVMTNNGSGKFVLSATYTVGVAPWYVAVADINGDGKPDLISPSASESNGKLTVLTNNGSGRFVTAGTYNAGYAPTCVAVGDVNGDGRLDLISPAGNANGTSGTLNVFLNHPTAALLGYTPSFTGILNGNGGGLTNLSGNFTGTLNGYLAAHGEVTASGSINFGTGDFSVSKNGVGDFTVTYATMFNSPPTVTVTIVAGTLVIPVIYVNSAASVELQFYNPSGSLADPSGFDFIATGRR